jgi:hypothetical protein
MTNYKCEVHGLLGGSLPWSLGMYFTGSVSEAATETAWKNANETAWATGGTPLLGFMSADVTVTEYQTATLTTSFKQSTLTADTVSHAGTDAAASLPWDSAMVVTFRTIQRNKSGHGRIFLPPLASDQILAHVYKAATCTSIASIFQTLRASMTTAGLQQFIFNRATLVDGTAPFTIKNVTGGDVSNKPASQDRRTSKVIPARTTFT